MRSTQPKPTAFSHPSQPVKGRRIKVRTSLARRTIFVLALVIVGATLVTTILTYFYLTSILETQYQGQLEKYVVERGQREQSIFTLAQDNGQLLKEHFLKLLAQQANKASNPGLEAQVNAEFDLLFVKMADGAIRNRPEGFDGKEQVGMYIGPKVALTTEMKNRIITYYNLANSFGPAWHNRFQDTYFADAEGIITVYWPESPTWTQDTPADYDLPGEEWFNIADLTHDPQRKTVWTGVYFDPVSKLWLVSTETPIDAGGKHLANIGQDITLNELLQRTVNEHLDGAYNVVLRGDGELLAHPQLMELIQQKEGKLDVAQSGDAHLLRIFEKLKQNIDPKSGDLQKVVVTNDQDGEYLAVAHISGPDWYFITVVPKSILAQTAFETARFILVLGSLALLLELVVLWLFTKKLVARPLTELTTATRQVASGNLTVKLDVTREDELGELAVSFNTMIEAVAEREAKLAAVGEQVLSGTAELKATASQQAMGSKQQATALTQINASVNELNATANSITALALQVKESSQQVVGASQLIYETTTLAVSQSARGQDAVVQTITVSTEAANLYQDLLSKMENLQARSSNMSHILELLNSIAAETHLLSLNAAIEAAGAGEQGERFRVVAQEVKNLAQRSSTASREVVEIVQQIDLVINGAVQSVEIGHAKAQELTLVPEEAGTVIEELRQVAEQAEAQADAITQAASQSLELSQQIEIATYQQGSSSKEVLGVLSGISIAAQQNAMGSSVVSATAIRLEEVSRNLNAALPFSAN